MTNSDTSGMDRLRLSGETVAAMLARGERLPAVVELTSTIPLGTTPVDLGTTTFVMVAA